MKTLKLLQRNLLYILLWCVGKRRKYIMDKGFKWWESTGQIKQMSKVDTQKTIDEYNQLINS